MANKVPTKEDFARAKAEARMDERGLSEVSENVQSQFKKEGIHMVMLIYSRRNDEFGAYVFFAR